MGRGPRAGQGTGRAEGGGGMGSWTEGQDRPSELEGGPSRLATAPLLPEDARRFEYWTASL